MGTQVDGTSGFIRHQQYAVCLALIVKGRVELGVIGCPNLGSEPAKIGEEVIPNGDGVVMVAIRGEGSWSVSQKVHITICSIVESDPTHSVAPIGSSHIHSSKSPIITSSDSPSHIPRICRSGSFGAHHPSAYR